MMPTTLDESELQLAREAAEWRLLSLLFECPCPSWHQQLESLAGEVADEGLKAAVELAKQEASEGLFHHTFGPGGPAPAREASYRNTVELGYFMSELQAHYNAFAYSPATDEPADHISVEAGFFAYLKLKQCYALACDDAENLTLTREAASRFLAEHLAVVGQPLAERLQHSGIPYLSQAAASLRQRLGNASHHQSNPLRVLQDNEELSCAPSEG